MSRTVKLISSKLYGGFLQLYGFLKDIVLTSFWSKCQRKLAEKILKAHECNVTAEVLHLKARISGKGMTKNNNGNFSEGGDPALSTLMPQGPKSPHLCCRKWPFIPVTLIKDKWFSSQHSPVCCSDITGAAIQQLWLHKSPGAHSVNCRSYDNFGPQAHLWVCSAARTERV